MFDDNHAPWLEKPDKDLTNLVAYEGSIIKQIGVKPVWCKWGKKNFVANFHIVYAEDHPVLFGLSTLRYLGSFVEHPLMFIEAARIRPVHMIKRSVTQIKKRPLGVLKIEDMHHSTSATHPY